MIPTETLIRARELLTAVRYVNIATASRVGVPWNTPVYAVWTSELTCYWSSWIQAEHSRNIRENDQVFLTLYDSTRPRGTNNLRCLYLRARAEEVAEPSEIANASAALYPGEDISAAIVFSGASVKRVYKAIPEQAWLNDRSEREVGPETVKMRVEVPLAELRSLMSAA
jgi:hypothetical protein